MKWRKKPKGPYVNAGESIATLYKILEKTSGSLEAKQSVTDMLFNVISRLHEEGLPVNEANITDRLAQYTDDFVQASKSDVA